MNANELADELEEFSGNGAFKYYLEIAAMLRQQQAEIKAMKERNLFLESIYRTIKVREK